MWLIGWQWRLVSELHPAGQARLVARQQGRVNAEIASSKREREKGMVARPRRRGVRRSLKGVWDEYAARGRHITAALGRRRHNAPLAGTSGW